MAALPLQPQAALREVRAWGWPFVAGAAGLLAAAFVSFGVVPRVQREAAAMAADADRAARQASRAAVVAARPDDTPSTRFFAGFPAAETRQARVATLLELAVHHALALQRCEFQLSRDKATGLLRYSVTMPVTGTYAPLRAFIEDALATDPALSLDKLRLRRAAPTSATLEADLAWSFYMRPGDGAASGAAR